MSLRIRLPALPLMLAAALLAGCAQMPAMPSLGGDGASAAGPAAPQPVAVPRPAAGDALGGFLADAAPGASGVLPGLGPVRVARAYVAASGRACRELLLGGGAEERSVVYCESGGAWAPARPLIRGGTARP